MAKRTKTDRDLKKFSRDLKKFFKKVSGKDEMEFLGEESIKIIRDRTRKNMQGVEFPYGRRKKLRKVTPEYAEYRKKIKNRLRSAANGDDCNLTLRGTMLNNMSVLHATKGSVVIGHTGRKNQQKAEYHHATGRPFMNLALVEVKKLMKLYEKRAASEAIKV